MAWTAGTQLGGYEITGLLGAGAMGEVYRARNVRLQRDVALKVLPSAVLTDPDRRARLEREARVLAALNHPNIAAIYGIEDMEGPGGRAPVLVLELVEGQTIADRLTAGRLPVDDAIAIGLQVAEALEEAHERGIIHRDLKPANVQVTRAGIVKVLDFGLAKALDRESSAVQSDPAQSPTFTSASTQIGAIMGTAAYMAPEQARGKTIDRRADIWAFGALLFEMLTGTRAFPGETMSDTLAAVLTSTPDWDRLPPEAPPAVRALVRRCLERDARQRLQSIGEARIVLTNPGGVGVDRPVQSIRAGVSPLVAAALVFAAIVLTGTAARFWIGRATGQSSEAVRKLDLALDGQLVRVRLDRVPVLSPDGRRVAYVAEEKLWTRSLGEFMSKEVPGSGGAVYPFWSPDGQQVAFIRNLQLWRASMAGGEPQLVGPVPSDITGSGAGVWTEAGNFLLVGGDVSGIIEISGRDGTSRELLPLDRKKESDFHEISELPDGRGVLFTVHAGAGADTIAVLADGTRKDVLKLTGETLRHPVYDTSGYLLFGRESTRRGVWAVRFSLGSLETEGTPFLVEATGNAPSVSRDGTLAFVRRSGSPSDLLWIDRGGDIASAGTLEGQVPEALGWRTMRLSSDGQKLAVIVSGASGEEMAVHDLPRGLTSTLSRGAQVVAAPLWAPDGRILFGAFAGARAWNIVGVSQTGTSAPQRILPPSDDAQWPCALTRDGKSLVFAQGVAGTDLWIVPLDGSSSAKALMRTPAREQDAVFSPDGRWLAYVSDESGRFELYVRRFPIGDDRLQISNGGAGAFSWNVDGREILYRGGAAMLAVKVVEKDGRLEPSPPQRLFALADTALSSSFELAPDGQRFLFARATGSDHISVILNWAQSLPKQ